MAASWDLASSTEESKDRFLCFFLIFLALASALAHRTWLLDYFLLKTSLLLSNWKFGFNFAIRLSLTDPFTKIPGGVMGSQGAGLRDGTEASIPGASGTCREPSRAGDAWASGMGLPPSLSNVWGHSREGE